jgi:hypothetical protein
MSESPEKQIENFILEWWDYPSKEDMDNFIYGRDCSYTAAQLNNALERLQEEGKILYDDKRECWLWVEPSEKMKKIIERGGFIKI